MNEKELKESLDNDNTLSNTQKSATEKIESGKKGAKSKKHFLGYIVTAVISILLTIAVVVIALDVDLSRIGEQFAIVKKILQIDSITSQNYIDDYDTTNVADGAAKGYISAIGDDYAAYFSVEEETQQVKNYEGTKLGIGADIAVDPETRYLTVIYVNRNSPAKKAGLVVGDALMSYNGESVQGKTATEVAEAIQGNSGDKLELKIYRNKSIIITSITIEDYTADSVDWRVYKNYGIIHIMNFDDTTKKQFDEALKSFDGKDVKGYIIDLRNNLGGTVETCTEILDEILPKGDICRVKYKSGKIETIATSDDKHIDMPMCLLVNEYSASASEIFALEMRDYNRAKLVGTKTYGKGIMQSTYELPDKSAVKFTISQIVDKNGETYHKKGLEPDIKSELTEDQSKFFAFLSDDDDPQLQAGIKQLASEIK